MFVCLFVCGLSVCFIFWEGAVCLLVCLFVCLFVYVCSFVRLFDAVQANKRVHVSASKTSKTRSFYQHDVP